MNIVFRLGMVLCLAGMSPLAFGQEWQDRFFDSSGVRIRYIDQGTGEPVVLVHGYTGSIEMNWVAPKVFGELAKNFRVIALDCRGHGKSGKPHDPGQYGQEVALDVVRLLNHLKIPKAHIVGYSMGSVITAKLLTLAPNRFLDAVLGGQGALLEPTDSEIRRFEELAGDVEKGSMRTLVSMISPKGQPPPAEAMMEQAEIRFREVQDLPALAAFARSVRNLKITNEQARRIHHPTMALIGSDDPFLEGIQQLKLAMPELKIITIQGANHANAYWRPEFKQALKEFLKTRSTKSIQTNKFTIE
ncbi:MAG: alpha/beta hydrolase [Acidobacteria bacterium]|nr:alpha/beta hydrolase [Acidobacteriota bacterium]